MSGARTIVLAGTMAALAVEDDDDADADGEDATATALLEAVDALFDAALAVLVLVAAADVAEEGATVEMDTFESVARLDRRLDAAEGSSVSVSDEVVEVEVAAAPEAMVLMDRLVSVARLDRRLEAADGSRVEVSMDEGRAVTVTVTTPVAVSLDAEEMEEVVALAESDAVMDVVEAERVLERCLSERVVSVLVEAAADADSEVVAREERLDELEVVLPSSSSSQSVGKSMVLFVLFFATSPVAPVAWTRARAVFFVVHKTSTPSSVVEGRAKQESDLPQAVSCQVELAQVAIESLMQASSPLLQASEAFRDANSAFNVWASWPF